MNESIVIKSLKDIREQNEVLITGSEIYISKDGIGKVALETVYDTSLIKEELKDGDVSSFV